MESAVANLVVPGEPAVGRLVRQVRRAMGGALRRLRRRDPPVEFEWGETVDPAALDDALAGLARRRAPCSPPSRRPRPGVRQRHPGLERGRHGARIAALRRRGLRARRGRPAAGRVGGGRGRLRLAEVADVPAGPGVRLRVRAGDGARRRAPRSAATTSIGAAPPTGQREEPPNSAFTPAVTLFRALDVALDLLLEEGLRAGLRPPRPARPRGAGRHRGARPGALRSRRRERQRGHRRPAFRRAIDGAAGARS